MARAIAYDIAKRRNEGEEPTECQVQGWMSPGTYSSARAAIAVLSSEREAVGLSPQTVQRLIDAASRNHATTEEWEEHAQDAVNEARAALAKVEASNVGG